MPKKESRGDWVAVPPQFSGASSAVTTQQEIRKPQSAYQYFQKSVADEIKATFAGRKFDIAEFGRSVRSRWEALSEDARAPYEQQAREDGFRYAQESHQADVATIERREQLQREHNRLLLDTDGGDQRVTRKGLAKKERRRLKKKNKKTRPSDGQDFVEDDEDNESNADSWEDELSDSEDEDNVESKKKAQSAPRVFTEKQREYREQKQQEKAQKEAYIVARQQDLRHEKASQAKKRLDFLLQQSNIFQHFGLVKEDSARYGTRVTMTTTDAENTQRESASTRHGQDHMDPDVDDAAALEEADEHAATYLRTQPSTLAFGKMRPYQLEGLNWMIRLQENGVNGILADEMGLGKTLQSISILVYMLEFQNVSGPHLILVPKSTLSNWMNEIARWAPTLKAIRFHGDKVTREEIIRSKLEPAMRDEDREWNVVVTTYEICNIEKNTLNKFAWSYLIIDEAHRLKNEASAFSKTVRLFETRYRVLLTGTPLQNSLHELWALLNFLVPDVFESAEQFDEWFNLDIEDNDEKNKLISQLHKILRPFMLRRLKADVEKSLPPKHETILFTGMSAMQKKLYRDILIRDIDAVQGTSGSRTAILNIVMQLRKCAGHPYLFPGTEDRSLPPLGEHLVENCGKMVVLDKLLKRLHERGHRVLLFTQMTRVLDIMEDYLVMRRFPYCRIDGNTSYEQREECIDAYNAPNSEKFIFLLSTRAGGLGINLQTADVVILYDSDWNPQADLQAQDRAHRIGQKRAVQVFRLVTEHTVEEKIVERAQQKLKLDAMVVQQGRLKDKDKLSHEELLAAVRFGADKIFKSKDSSITDDDIDLVLDQGKQKTQELNDKLKAADKGDLLDFKLDGSSVQTFEGVDYSTSALAQAKSQAEMLGIFDLGKRERKEANYNENSLYQRQIAALQGVKEIKKKKDIRLPKHLRLPRMEEWQMYDREKLQEIQEEEESAFKALPEELQKLATMKRVEQVEEAEIEPEPQLPFELPPLLTEERQAEKERLLAEGFSDWNRFHYQAFWRASARHGRRQVEKIALEVGKDDQQVARFLSSFWGEVGKNRIAEHEYERVVKFVERGEKKIGEIKGLERGTRILVGIFDNPWEELEFTHINCKDKLFTIEEDRHLLCWTRKYGYGHWQAIKNAVRRNPNFRFDYFLRSLPVELLGKRCEQLMKAAEKEVEQIESHLREALGLPTEAIEGQEPTPITIPKFHELQRQMNEARKAKAAIERKQLECKVYQLEEEMRVVQDRLNALNRGVNAAPMVREVSAQSEKENDTRTVPSSSDSLDQGSSGDKQEDGAVAPDGSFLAFPVYDGSELPDEWKKPFTHFCIQTRREIKSTLSPSEKKNKKRVNELLKERWIHLSEDNKAIWREWCEWDKKRYAYHLEIYRARRGESADLEVSNKFEEDGVQSVHVPKKRKSTIGGAIPKKIKKDT